MREASQDGRRQANWIGVAASEAAWQQPRWPRRPYRGRDQSSFGLMTAAIARYPASLGWRKSPEL